MKKRHAAYWKERFSILNQASAEYGQAVYAQIESAFTAARRDIQRDIDAWYARFAGNNGVTLVEAKRLLNSRELSELKWDIGQYIKYGKQNALDGKWVKQLENASARFHITRLEALQLRTQQALEKAFGNELDTVDGLIRRTVTNDYYRTAFELQKGFGSGFDIGEISTRELDKIVKKPWTADGRTFSDRIWAKKQQMIGDLHNELTRCCIYGRSQKDAIARLEQYVDKSVKNAKYCARRIVVTEQAYFSSRSQYNALKELNVKEYEIDLPTAGCDICREMNGRHFPMSAYEVGSTAPPFHPNCENGGIIPYFDDNEFALPDGKEATPLSEDTSFEEWERKFVKGEGLTSGGDSDIIKNKAKTVDEAKKVAEKYAHSVSFAGATNLDALNELNDTLNHLYSTYKIAPLDTLEIKSTHGFEWAEANYNILNIMDQFINDPLNAVNRSTVNWTTGHKDSLKKWNEYLDGLSSELGKGKFREEYLKKQISLAKKTIKELENDLQYPRHNVVYVGQEVRSVITHEFGHIIADQKIFQITPSRTGTHFAYDKNNLYWQKCEMVKDTFRQAKTSGDIFKISKYASKNEAEFFAECFCIYDLGIEQLPDYIIKMIEEVIAL